MLLIAAIQPLWGSQQDSCGPRSHMAAFTVFRPQHGPQGSDMALAQMADPHGQPPQGEIRPSKDNIVIAGAIWG